MRPAVGRYVRKMISEAEARGLKATLVTNVLRILARGGLILILTRVFFSPRQYGILFFAISVFSVALLFASFGIAKSSARYVTEFLEKDPSQVPHILECALKYRVAMILVTGAGFVLFGESLAHHLGRPETAPLMVLGAGYVAFRSLQSFTVIQFQGFNRVFWSAVVNALTSIGQVVFVVGLVWLGFGVTGAVVGYVASFVVAAAVGLWILYSNFYRNYERATCVEPGLRRRIRKYSVPLLASRGANVVDKRVDMILLGLLVNPIAVGYYTLGKQISGFVMAPAASLGFTVAPTYSQRKEQGRRERAARIYESSFEYVLLMYVPAAVGMALVADPAIRVVFGSAYRGAIPVVQIFGGFVVFQAIDKVTNDGLDYLGRSRARAYTRSFAAGLNFVLNLVLIPSFGAVGAAVATVVTYALMVFANVYIIHDELSVRARRLARSALLIVGISLFMGGTLLLVLPYVSNLVTLGAAVLLGVAVWALLSTLLGLLDVKAVASFL